MSDFLTIDLEPRETATLTLEEYPSSDASVYMVLKAGTVKLVPEETINAVIVPSSKGWTPTYASGILIQETLPQSIPSQGIFYWHKKNDTADRMELIGDLVKINLQNYYFENSKFDLHWIQKVPDNPNKYNNDLAVYSLPHNLQPSPGVSLSVEPINGLFVRYGISFPAVANSGDAAYALDFQPYQLGFSFNSSVRKSSYEITSGVINGNNVGFLPDTTSGFAPPLNTGIVFDLPMYDPRFTGVNIPAKYEIYVGYMGAGGAESKMLYIYSDHYNILNSVETNLEAKIAREMQSTDLFKVGEETIKSEVIPRRRLSIGIKDIVTSKNSYVSQGVYVSPYFTSDTGLYTFSLKVKETIPNYLNVDPYTTVRYFAEFNSLGWEPISPLSRNQEYDSNGKEIPKMLVFDKDPGEKSFNIKYMDYSVSITSFRIKIVFDITKVSGLKIPPEVNDYRCVIFDKNQLLEL